MIGRSISHYEILEKLGEGCVGFACKAGGTRLALKEKPCITT